MSSLPRLLFIASLSRPVTRSRDLFRRLFGLGEAFLRDSAVLREAGARFRLLLLPRLSRFRPDIRDAALLDRSRDLFRSLLRLDSDLSRLRGFPAFNLESLGFRDWSAETGRHRFIKKLATLNSSPKEPLRRHKKLQFWN